MRYLAVLVATVAGFLQSISLPNVFPPFLTDDFAPYIVAQTMSPGSLQFNVTTSSSYVVTVNATYVGSFTGNKTITLSNLVLGAHQLALSNGGQTYTFTVLVGGSQTFTHSVSVDTTVCSPDCGTFPVTTPMTLTAQSQVQAIMFNYISRIAVWTSVQGTQSFTALALDNYLVVMEGIGFQLHKGFKTPKSNQPISLSWKTGLSAPSGFSLTPRYHPQRTAYTLTPMIESTIGFDLSLKTVCFGACSVAMDSSTANFPTVAVVSSVWSPVISAMVNDTIIVSFSDPSGVQSTDYYAVSVSVKSRDKFLKSLAVVAGAAKDSYAGCTTLAALAAAVKGVPLPLNEAFSTVRLTYTLPDLDFNATLALVLLADTQSPFSALAIQSNATAMGAYWSANKTVVPVVGTNVIVVRVTAQDVGYMSLTTVTFKMLNNNAELMGISIPGAVWGQEFSPAVSEFTVGIPADWTSFPLLVRTVDPESFLSLYSTFTLPFQNLSGVLNATIPLPSLPFYNQSFVLRVNAETRSIVKQTVVWLWKEDHCGNGLRYTSSEQCDDGNSLNGDGCDSLCAVESGYRCVGGSTSQKDVCSVSSPQDNSTAPGNSTVGGNSTDPGSNSTEPTTNSTIPSGNSTVDTNSTETVCGDGVVDLPEECDDGNTVDGDGCSHNCTTEPTCGNSVREATEQCDDGNTVGGDGCSQNCTLEPGWECTSSTLRLDICTAAAPQLRVIPTPEQYFAYEYMGVSFGFPFVVLLIVILVGAVVLKGKGLGEGNTVWLAAGAGFLVTVVQILYILHDVGLEGNQFKMFAGFGWSHLQFDTAYPPFHSRRLASLAPTQHIRFFDNTLPFLLIVGAVATLQGVLYIVKRPWAMLDLWVPVYLVLFMVTHVPVLYYTVVSLAHLPDLTSAYDSINATAALIALTLLLGVVLLYAVSLRKAWGESSFLHFESIRCILCPGIKKPVQTIKKFIGMSSSDFSSSEIPKRLNQSFDATAIRDNNGFDDVENEDSTARARIMSADIQKKKQGVTPDFSMYFSKSRVMKEKGVFWSLTYLLSFSETMLCTTVLALGQTILGRLLPLLVLEIIAVVLVTWQRPFVCVRYNLAHSCIRVVFAVLVVLLVVGTEIDDAGIIVVLFFLLGLIFALEIFEVATILLLLLAPVKSPEKLEIDEKTQQPNVRQFTLHGDDHLSLEPPDSVPDERHASSMIDEENECPGFDEEVSQG